MCYFICEYRKVDSTTITVKYTSSTSSLLWIWRFFMFFVLDISSQFKWANVPLVTASCGFIALNATPPPPTSRLWHLSCWIQCAILQSVIGNVHKTSEFTYCRIYCTLMPPHPSTCKNTLVLRFAVSTMPDQPYEMQKGIFQNKILTGFLSLQSKHPFPISFQTAFANWK